MSDKHKIKFEIIRKNFSIGFVEPLDDSGSSDYELSSSSSIYAFPTAHLKTTNTEINQLFMGFSESDIVRISVAKDNNTPHNILFEGEFHEKVTQIEKNGESMELNLDIRAIHSFYRLSMLTISSKVKFHNTSFKEFIDWLMKSANISSRVNIDNILSDSPVNVISSKINAFRLFKDVCLIKDVVVTLHSDNSVSIEHKETKRKRTYEKKPITLTGKDIISSTTTESI